METDVDALEFHEGGADMDTDGVLEGDVETEAEAEEDRRRDL